MKKECFGKHIDASRKLAGLYIFETLAFCLGKTFEMYAKDVLPYVLQGISDNKDSVRQAAL